MQRSSEALVDVMRVPVDGDPSGAVVPVGNLAGARMIACDVLVVGGGTGGVAAALAAARRGRRVHLTEETDWIGGQLTAQGVSALDEHDHIERFGGTAGYYSLRNAIRDHYRPHAGAAGRRADFNPGNCWVTRLAFEPKVAVAALMGLLQPHIDAGRVILHLRSKPAAAEVDGDRIISVTTVDLERGGAVRFCPAVVLDATELGDLLPLVGAEYNSGAETVAETGEPHAQPTEPKPHCLQSFTYVLGVARRPLGEHHVIAQPARYDFFRSAQPYSLRIEVHGGEIYGEASGWLSYKVFETMPGTKGGLWTYRRLIDSTQFGSNYPTELSIFNWPGNDYREASIIDRPAAAVAAALQDAKRASLGFLRWVQTEAPAEADRLGAPELRLQTDIMGTADGVAKFPYIRESRRIKALRTTVEQDVSAHFQRGPTAAHFEDAVGVGWYPIDIHRAGPEDVGISCRTRPFQIALGSLIPMRLRNLIAAAKNIGTTHITNGCYRLHPVEWNIGEAAGALAAFCLDRGEAPAVVHGNAELRSAFQLSLVAEGVPLDWAPHVQG
ncbi:MAG TPA: FAD-dependent oxidoreductase [Hyphomicrobiaceae bacterium]|nr:FAD-dependent oxidoreductase [Hyphomicrobiaceae bacterium]